MLRSAALSLTILLGTVPLAVAPAFAQTVIVESRVAASTDDAEEAQSGDVSIIGSDLELGWDGDPQLVGMRFPNLALPQGANITMAWVQFEADESASTALTVRFQAEASDDAESFSGADQDLTDRSRETPLVFWAPPAWTAGQSGAAQRTPNLSSLVQAVVNRPGWVAGNALVLFVEDPSGGSTRRTATSWNSDPTNAPLLHVEYALPPTTTSTTTTTTSTTTTSTTTTSTTTSTSTTSTSTSTTTSTTSSTTTTTTITTSTTTTTLPGTPPTVEILSPLHLIQFPEEEEAQLSGTAIDAEDGDISASLMWTSSLDGILGIGASFSTPLSVGIHTLTADVLDSHGHPASASVDVRVTAEGHLILTAGDIATCNSFFGDEATANILDERFGEILLLGDNVYPDGKIEEFEECFEPTWGRHKERMWPSPGNHEYHDDGAEGYFEYFGAVAGDPDKGYYSFDIGSWHIVMANSNCNDIGGCDPGDPQTLWLEADLAANPSDCSLMVLHHPRFSSGVKHGSNDKMEDLYAIFHAHGGDLVLSGHDHNYERFAPQDADGNFDVTAPRQFVVGTGGVNVRDMGDIEPNSEASAANLFGILEMTLLDGSYEWNYLPAAGYSYTDFGSANCVGLGTPPPNGSPQVVIDTPISGSVINENTAVSFSGSASDAEDGSLTASLSWSSNRDGLIGTGPSFVVSSLTVGSHRITASVADSQGATGAKAISINVVRPDSFTIEKRIAVGADDAEEELSGPHNVSLTSGDLELGEDKNEQLVGMRFTDLDIPQGILILDAWLQFEAASSSSGSMDLEIRYEDVDDAPAFQPDRRDLSDRSLSSSFVSWSPPAWSGGDQDAEQQSPSLADLVQEIVDRPGWAPGNDLALMISGLGTRRAESFEGNAAAAPLLHVRYRNPDWVPPGGGGPGCGIGPELVLALPTMAAMRRLRRPRRA
jgi:hypothetical protein